MLIRHIHPTLNIGVPETEFHVNDFFQCIWIIIYCKNLLLTGPRACVKLIKKNGSISTSNISVPLNFIFIFFRYVKRLAHIPPCRFCCTMNISEQLFHPKNRLFWKKFLWLLKWTYQLLEVLQKINIITA